MKQVVYKSSNMIAVSADGLTITSPRLLSDFIAYLDVSPATTQTYTKSLRQLFRYLTTQGISNPTRESLLEFRSSLEASGYQASTIALYLAATRRFFAWCEVKGIYPNIASGLKAPRISKGHKKDCMTGEDVKKVINCVDRRSVEGLRNYAVLALMATCGLRTIEIVRANVEDLRLTCGVPVLYVQGKGRQDKADFVKLSEPVLKAIREYLRARGQVSDTEPLFASCSRRNYGGRLTTRTISSIAKTAMVKAGYNSTRLTAHSFRHTAITLALMNGHTLAEVQYFARHSSVNTTMIYNHAVNRMKSLCELSVSSAIFG